MLIYKDTSILLLTQKYLKGPEYNILMIGNRVIHLKNCRDKGEQKKMLRLINEKKISKAMKYTLLIEYCIAKNYFNQAKSYIEQLKREDAESYLAVKEALKQNEIFKRLEIL